MPKMERDEMRALRRERMHMYFASGGERGQDVCHKLVSSCSAYARETVAPTEKSGQVQQVSWICGCVASSSYCGASQHHARRVGKERKLSTHKLCGIASELAS